MEAKHIRVMLPAAIVRVGVAVACVWGAVGLCCIGLAFQLSSAIVHLDTQAVTAGKSAQSILAGVDATLANINRPCQGSAGPDACGTLAQINKVAIATSDISTTARMQIAQSGRLITAATDNMNSVGSHVSDAVDQLGGTAHSATVTIDAGRDYFVAAQPRLDLFLAHVDSVTVAGNRSLDQFNAMLADPRLGLIESNAVSLSGTGAHMLLTADQVETKLAQCTLHPHPSCYLKSDLLLGAQLGGYLLPK